MAFKPCDYFFHFWKKLFQFYFRKKGEIYFFLFFLNFFFLKAKFVTVCHSSAMRELRSYCRKFISCLQYCKTRYVPVICQESHKETIFTRVFTFTCSWPLDHCLCLCSSLLSDLLYWSLSLSYATL